MRRVVLGLLSVLVTVAILAPPALAQAPTPKVTITGQIDNILNLNRNLNNTGQDRNVRGGQTSPGDQEFGAYTRGRWDIIGQLGKAKAVMGWEIDMHYGGFSGTNGDTCVGTLFAGTAAGNCGSRGDGSSGGLDADTDVRVPIELKWMYVEFPLTGPGSLLPFIPIEGTGRVGGQPFVYLADSSGNGSVAKQRAISLGDTIGNDYAVTAGLKAGEQTCTDKG